MLSFRNIRPGPFCRSPGDDIREYLFSELKDIGLLISFYLIGCVTNKFCEFRIHKRLVLVCMAAISALYVGWGSVATVSTYSKTIYKKLGINNRAELFILFGQAPKSVSDSSDTAE